MQKSLNKVIALFTCPGCGKDWILFQVKAVPCLCGSKLELQKARRIDPKKVEAFMRDFPAACGDGQDGITVRVKKG